MKSRTWAATSPEVGCISLGRAGTRANLVEQNQPCLPLQIPEPLNKHYITSLLSILTRKLLVRELLSTLFSMWGEGRLWRPTDLLSAMVEASATPLCLSDCPLNTSPHSHRRQLLPWAQTVSSVAQPTGLPVVLGSPFLPSLPLPAHLALLGGFSHL